MPEDAPPSCSGLLQIEEKYWANRRASDATKPISIIDSPALDARSEAASSFGGSFVLSSIPLNVEAAVHSPGHDAASFQEQQNREAEAEAQVHSASFALILTKCSPFTLSGNYNYF